MKISKNNVGFTIMELMIAITVFSIILLLGTEVMMGVGNLFAKGVNMANVQDDTRNIISNVTTAVQFSGAVLNNGQGPTAPIENTYTYDSGPVPTYAYCFGNIRYSFVLGFPSSGSWPRTLWVDKMQSASGCSPLNIEPSTPNCIGNTKCSNSQSGSGADLTGSNMHLASFRIYQYNPNLYGIFVGLAFGKQDMFESSSGQPTVINGNYVCSTAVGQQYCATSYLSTLATERISQD